eukprot:gnl/MRDRNA2_/MRDRNA2_85672_c0_seq2.p1 gnl/MRDRNA2_/MRDRNA2_85672_c0~~gnl/MRDRNA2_/MRDRNA2_85672_c0_seq2.p1  ORF type:complete len:128 (+),score=15.50 gnl/MRDRNA2_/MRDRNA2_85672_c0_seq2:258-641(+)
MVASRDGRILAIIISAVMMGQVKFFDVRTWRLLAQHMCYGKEALAEAVMNLGIDGSAAIGCNRDVFLWDRTQILENNWTEMQQGSDRNGTRVTWQNGTMLQQYKNPMAMEQIARIVRTRANDENGRR